MIHGLLHEVGPIFLVKRWSTHISSDLGNGVHVALSDERDISKVSELEVLEGDLARDLFSWLVKL